MKDWYKQLVVYQIWPRSFCDGNGDGIGDLEGVLSKLDYLQDLGINCIWFSPLYPSPNADFGYDIADYKNIHKEYGNLDLFRQVLDGAHKRGMKVIMDLVVNHTSDEHEWFIKSKDPSSPYHDYYFWRKGRLGGKLPPNNWLSCFEGKAWERDEKSGEYYLHVFAKKQPDLNHDNPKVRQEVKDIMKFWLDMGVDGFREDVITFISKRPGLPNGIPLPIGCGIEHYMDGPNIHKYLSEYREITDKYDCFTVGEAPMMTPDNALKYIDESHKELDMMFHFQHIEADAFLIDFLQTKFRLKEMKRAFTNWQNKLNGRAWNTLYIENHDHPRIISRYGSEKYRVQSGKMLANMYMLQQGTPFVYQGQELGMLNTRLGSIDDYVDCFVKNNYDVAINKLHMKKEKHLNLPLNRQEIIHVHPFSGTIAKTQDLLPVRRGFLLMKITSKSMQKPKWQILILFIITIKSSLSLRKKTTLQSGEIIRNITKIPISFMFIHAHSTAKDFWLLIRFPMSVCRLKRQRALTLKREHLFFAIMKIILFSATVLSSDLMKQEFICLNNLQSFPIENNFLYSTT